MPLPPRPPPGDPGGAPRPRGIPRPRPRPRAWCGLPSVEFFSLLPCGRGSAGVADLLSESSLATGGANSVSLPSLLPDKCMRDGPGSVGIRVSLLPFGGFGGAVMASAGKNSNGSSQDVGTQPDVSPALTRDQPEECSSSTLTTAFSLSDSSFSSTASKSKTMNLLGALRGFSGISGLARPLADPIPPPRSIESVVKLRCPVEEICSVGRVIALCVFCIKPVRACPGTNGAGVMSVNAMLPSGRFCLWYVGSLQRTK
mmetsp:Transcript_4074/g.14400  ORF Transcript_4074/g.14400 Transcript_4074/m.14400 type:complete len:257 (-) Transcript_4074:772-1542(-)